jgi:hypothetical protein
MTNFRRPSLGKSAQSAFVLIYFRFCFVIAYSQAREDAEVLSDQKKMNNESNWLQTRGILLAYRALI